MKIDRYFPNPERYENADIKTKRQIIGSIFSEKLQFENNAYRTAKVNEAVTLICTLDAAFKVAKKEQTSDFASLSKEVIPLGLSSPYTGFCSFLHTLL